MSVIGMKQVDNDKKTTLTHDFTVGHEVEVIVRAIGPDGTEQAMEHAVRNTIVIQGKLTTPNSPTALTATGAFLAINLSWTNPPDYDFSKMEIWRSATDLGTAVKIAEVKGLSYIDSIGISGATFYYWIRAANTSGKISEYYPRTGAGVSATTLGITSTSIDDFAVTATKMFTKTIILSADAWTDNSPGAGSIAWNAHVLVYNGVRYTITGSDANQKYVYWVIGATTYSKTNNHPSAALPENTYFIIATNISGTHDLAWNKMANAVIGNAWIQDLAVTDAKIATLTANKLTAGTIDASIITVTNLNATNLTVGTLPVARIGATSVEASKLGTTVISGGKIITGLLTATNIQTGTLTGRRIQTAAAGQRAVMDIVDNTFRLLDNAGNTLVLIDDNLDSGGSGMRVENAAGAAVELLKDADNFFVVYNGGWLGRFGGVAVTELNLSVPECYFTGNLTVVDGNIIVSALATVDGRDVSVDGTKLDGIDNNADVTGDNPPQAHNHTTGNITDIPAWAGEAGKVLTVHANGVALIWA